MPFDDVVIWATEPSLDQLLLHYEWQPEPVNNDIVLFNALEPVRTQIASDRMITLVIIGMEVEHVDFSFGLASSEGLEQGIFAPALAPKIILTTDLVPEPSSFWGLVPLLSGWTLLRKMRTTLAQSPSC